MSRLIADVLTDDELGRVYDETAFATRGAGGTWADINASRHAVVTLMRDLLRHHLSVVDLPEPLDLAKATMDAAYRLGHARSPWTEPAEDGLHNQGTAQQHYLALATALVAEVARDRS